ncbi:MAG TPA: SUMF1/EgtB/PvdO family nonheme iron enzyme [Agriterribacter sp.]|nr:SUMF1/EgtB/PvdO family nonheme iron enzyme [Agriterribacter sp.]
MQRLLNFKSLLFLSAVALLFSSCKNGLFGKKKFEKSDVTGWNYNDKNMGGFNVSKEKEQNTGPGLVFVQGGTFTMGATDEDVMGEWNNIPRRVTVSSFYIDKTEVANVHYREYLHWLESVFDDPQYAAVLDAARPDTLVWREELAYNEPLVEYYFRHPSYNYYPVVGVSWKQASDFCLWRSDRVNERILVEKGYINKNQLKTTQGQGEENFNTQAYLKDLYQPQPGKPKKNPLMDANGRPRTKVTFEDGYMLPQKRNGNMPLTAISIKTPNPRKNPTVRAKSSSKKNRCTPGARM